MTDKSAAHNPKPKIGATYALVKVSFENNEKQIEALKCVLIGHD